MIRHRSLLLVVFALVAPAAGAKTFLTQEQALARAFPRGTQVVREPFFLSAVQMEEVRKRSDAAFDQELAIRYVGLRDGAIVGYAYFDAHRVRTLPETVMVVVTPGGSIERVEILSFAEPEDYLPRPRWLEQFRGRKLGAELSLRGAIRPITGASLSGRAIVNASRRILALHQVLPPRKGSK
ncbi:MAG TPA: FMN-binding protein [Thermoanaerobaculia bacterium]